MDTNRNIVRLGMAALGATALMTTASPALANYVTPDKAATVAREHAVLTEGHAAVIEAMLARAAISSSPYPIVFDDALGPQVAAWSRTHAGGDFVVTPLHLSGTTVAVAFHDSNERDRSPYQRIADMMGRSGGKYVDGMSVSLEKYRKSGLPETKPIQLADEQILEIKSFTDHGTEIHAQPQVVQQASDPNLAAAKSLAAGALNASRNIYYGEPPASAARQGIENVVGNALNATLGSLHR